MWIGSCLRGYSFDRRAGVTFVSVGCIATLLIGSSGEASARSRHSYHQRSKDYMQQYTRQEHPWDKYYRWEEYYESQAPWLRYYQGPRPCMSLDDCDRKVFGESGSRGRMGLGADPAHPEGPGNVSN
jgi:hypothetical protein